MKDQLQTIREALEEAHDESLVENHFECRQILMAQITALDQIEAMVGEQEPVAYLTRDEDGGEAMLFFDKTEAATYCEEGVEPEALVLAFAAPVAQQPQAEPLGEAPTIAQNMAPPVASWDDSRTQKVYEVLVNDNYPPKGSADHWEGWKARLVVDALFPEQPQAEAVGEVVFAQLEYATVKWNAPTSSKGGGDPKNSYSWPVTGDKIYLAAPQQAEAVPSDVVRDAERYRWFRKNQLLAKVHFLPCATSEILDSAIDIAIAEKK